MPSVFLGLVRQAASIIAATAEDRARFAVLNYEIPLLQSSLLSDRAERNRLQSIPSDPQQSAWCADYTEELTGEVGTVEVTGEGEVGQFATWRRVIIRPGYENRANYNAARDGQMFHREGQFGYQAYFNAAILPGVQRWRPQYRIGVLTAVDNGAHTCSLNLQSEESSAQGLIVDPPSLALAGVPIDYMECNSDVFETGDRVLVEFQGRDWDSPKVIGFESNPRPCLPKYIVLKASDFMPQETIMPDATFWSPNGVQRTGTEHPWRWSMAFRSWTEFSRSDIDHDVPYSLDNHPDLGIMGLRHDFHTWSIFWSRPGFHWQTAEQCAAEFYDEVVGENRLTRDIFPDGWVSNEIRVIRPSFEIRPSGEASAFYFQQNWTFEVKQTGYQMFGEMSPSRVPVGFEDQVINRVAELIGYDKIISLDVDFTSLYHCDGSATATTYQSETPCPAGGVPPEDQLRPHGHFYMSIVEDGGEPAGPDFLKTISVDPIPETFTIKGKTYTLTQSGWVARGAQAHWRQPAYVYVLEGAPAPTYAAGFWAE